MTNQEFINKAKQLVADYTNDHMDKTDLTNNPLSDPRISPKDVYVVWMAKTLQNSKALLSTTVSDGMYYEATLDGDKGKIYFDAYKKFQNISYIAERVD
ncbi:DUF6275 family protein [Levilactobacillus brevis]|uniref:DUF6275 family protein n=1 Tax=Levilactobacillus brevis TaxID=1580 RepID=UPI0011195CA9|nr:DUF6275 family protein [Levilactobacillus brevis]QCZ43737.1 hypothetical protein UCCLBBS124_1413 [Levilactobacillus brevis]